MKRIFLCGLTSLALCVMVGCSIDRVEIVDHPSAAKPGDTINVTLSNIYNYISNSSVVMFPESRDSLHVLIGMPNGYEVISLDFYAAKNLNIAQLLSTETSALEQILDDSLASFYAQKQPMTLDGGLVQMFSGRSITAHGEDIDELDVNTNDVAQWAGFSSRVNISLTAGSRLDTAMALESFLDFAENSGFTDPIDTAGLGDLPISVDTVGLKVIPVFIFARIKTASRENEDTLFYYTKTGALPSPGSGSTTQISDIDIGDMVFVPLRIDATSIKRPRSKGQSGQMRVYQNNVNQNVYINIGTTPLNGVTVEIYSMTGTLVKKIIPDAPVIVWDGRDKHGRAVKSGSYIVRVIQGSHILTSTFKILP